MEKYLIADVDVASNLLLSKEVIVNDGGRTFNFRTINDSDNQEAMSKVNIKDSFWKDNISRYFQKIVFPSISQNYYFY